MYTLMISDQCFSGFPANKSGEGATQFTNSSLTTRLIPGLKFGCSGTIVQFTVTVVLAGNGLLGAKIQIWRENDTGFYYKPGSDIPLDRSASACANSHASRVDKKRIIFQCSLTQSARISVQPGDILGLELPHTNNVFDIIHFLTSGVPGNYVFQHQLSSTVNLSEADYVTYEQPQISFLVALGNNKLIVTCSSFYCLVHLIEQTPSTIDVHTCLYSFTQMTMMFILMTSTAQQFAQPAHRKPRLKRLQLT